MESASILQQKERRMVTYSTGVPPGEIDNRIKAFQSTMADTGVEGALILQKTDLFYFAGTVQQGWLYIPCQGNPLLMIFKEFDRAVQESGIDQVISLLSPKHIPDTIRERGLRIPETLGMELDVLPTTQYFQYRDIFPESSITDISLAIRLQRSRKSAFEIQQIRESGAFADRVSARVPELLEEGKTEIALSGELESYARSLGHQGIVRMRLWGSEIFYGHLMCGASGAVPSYMASPTGGPGTTPAIGQGPGFNTIKPGEPVLVDHVFAINGYIADNARIFSLGPIADDLLRAHDAMLEVQEMAKQKAVPGMETGRLYEMMVEMATASGYGDCFMGVGDRRIRFTGHGVGLELDEFPFIAKGQNLLIEKDMVIALEPKVVMPGRGVVGIENTLLVTDTGLESLTRFPEGVCVV